MFKESVLKPKCLKLYALYGIVYTGEFVQCLFVVLKNLPMSLRLRASRKHESSANRNFLHTTSGTYVLLEESNHGKRHCCFERCWPHVPFAQCYIRKAVFCLAHQWYRSPHKFERQVTEDLKNNTVWYNVHFADLIIKSFLNIPWR